MRHFMIEMYDGRFIKIHRLNDLNWTLAITQGADTGKQRWKHHWKALDKYARTVEDMIDIAIEYALRNDTREGEDDKIVSLKEYPDYVKAVEKILGDFKKDKRAMIERYLERMEQHEPDEQAVSPRGVRPHAQMVDSEQQETEV